MLCFLCLCFSGDFARCCVAVAHDLSTACCERVDSGLCLGIGNYVVIYNMMMMPPENINNDMTGEASLISFDGSSDFIVLARTLARFCKNE